jgi:hypothetical protein
MMKIELDWCHLQAGKTHHLLEFANSYIDYIEDCWIMAVTDTFLCTEQWITDTQKWPSISCRSCKQQAVVSLSTSYWKISHALSIPTVLVFHHFVMRFTGMG